MAHYYPLCHLDGNWDGNPFLYPIERLCFGQIATYFETINEESPLSFEQSCRESLCDLIYEFLSFDLSPSDHEMVVRQRLSGFYGPPYAMPQHPRHSIVYEHVVGSALMPSM
jgi:hypothetical protein